MKERNLWIVALLSLAFEGCGKVVTKFEDLLPKPSAPSYSAAASGIEGGTVIVRWRRESFPNPANTVAYLIYRGTSPNFQASNLTLIDVVRGTVTEYYDRPIEYDGKVSVEVDEDTGEITWEEEYEFPEERARKVRQETEYEFEYTHEPPTPGVQYWYRIARVAKERVAPNGSRAGRASDRGRLGWRLVVSEPSPAFGPVTPLERPRLESPPNRPNPGWDNVNTRRARFKWRSVAGADQYVIQVCDDPSFPADRRWESGVIYGSGQGGVLMEHVADISSKYPTGRKWRLFWRVGARNSKDACLPQPDGWVWSEVWEFGTVETPSETS